MDLRYLRGTSWSCNWKAEDNIQDMAIISDNGEMFGSRVCVASAHIGAPLPEVDDVVNDIPFGMTKNAV